jgi:hypothetical protein
MDNAEKIARCNALVAEMRRIIDAHVDSLSLSEAALVAAFGAFELLVEVHLDIAEKMGKPLNEAFAHHTASSIRAFPFDDYIRASIQQRDDDVVARGGVYELPKCGCGRLLVHADALGRCAVCAHDMP